MGLLFTWAKYLRSRKWRQCKGKLTIKINVHRFLKLCITLWFKCWTWFFPFFSKLYHKWKVLVRVLNVKGSLEKVAMYSRIRLELIRKRFSKCLENWPLCIGKFSPCREHIFELSCESFSHVWPKKSHFWRHLFYSENWAH